MAREAAALKHLAERQARRDGFKRVEMQVGHAVRGFTGR
jgi:hypothetical protein